MVKRYEFEKKLVRKLIKKFIKNDTLDAEIFLTTIKFVYRHSSIQSKDPIFDIGLKGNVSVWLNGSRELFNEMFDDMIYYWDLKGVSSSDVPNGREFERFETIEDLCMFFEPLIKGNARRVFF